MSGLKPGLLVMACFAIVFPIIAMTQPRTRTAGIFVLIILLALIVLLVVSIWRDRGKKEVLIQADANGVLDRNPVYSSPKYTAWTDVERMDVWGKGGSARSIELTLTNGKKTYIALGLVSVKPEYVLQKLEECRRSEN